MIPTPTNVILSFSHGKPTMIKKHHPPLFQIVDAQNPLTTFKRKKKPLPTSQLSIIKKNKTLKRSISIKLYQLIWNEI